MDKERNYNYTNEVGLYRYNKKRKYSVDEIKKIAAKTKKEDKEISEKILSFIEIIIRYIALGIVNGINCSMYFVAEKIDGRPPTTNVIDYIDWIRDVKDEDIVESIITHLGLIITSLFMLGVMIIGVIYIVVPILVIYILWNTIGKIALDYFFKTIRYTTIIFALLTAIMISVYILNFITSGDVGGEFSRILEFLKDLEVVKFYTNSYDKIFERVF